MRALRIRSLATTMVAIGFLSILCLPASAQARTSNGARASAPCARAHTLTLAHNSFARVYGNGADEVFACLIATGKSRRLAGASASQDVVRLGGKWVGWTSAQHTTVTLMHLTTGKIPSDYPYGVNDYVVNIVVKSDGAGAWVADVSDGTSYVQGYDRKNHSADQFSDDTKFVSGPTLKSLSGHAISWKYTDGTTGTATLF